MSCEACFGGILLTGSANVTLPIVGEGENVPLTRADLSNDRNVLDLALVSVKKTLAHVFEDLPAGGRGGVRVRQYGRVSTRFVRIACPR